MGATGLGTVQDDPISKLTGQMVEREHIIDEIRRTAVDGRALGRMRFEAETGIKEADWLGRYWVKWSDALAEAGFPPNELATAYSQDTIVLALITMVEDLGKWPTDAERRLYRREHPDMPSHNVYARLGKRHEQAQAVLDYAQEHAVTGDVLAICEKVATSGATPKPAEKQQSTKGYVYLLRSGSHYKVGHSNDPGRRAYEVRLVMPEPVTEVHRIETDDPAGVEAYWHRRFADRRAEGEWFKLEKSDVRAFRARKTM